jgi:hypothetical protein
LRQAINGPNTKIPTLPIYPTHLVNPRPALRQAINGPNTKIPTLPNRGSQRRANAALLHVNGLPRVPIVIPAKAGTQ